jgi:hypothetical protein
MTCGVVVPVDAEPMEDTLFDNVRLLHHTELKQLADDSRFATAIYRSALNTGITDHAVFREPVLALS